MQFVLKSFKHFADNNLSVFTCVWSLLETKFINPCDFIAIWMSIETLLNEASEWSEEDKGSRSPANNVMMIIVTWLQWASYLSIKRSVWDP